MTFNRSLLLLINSFDLGCQVFSMGLFNTFFAGGPVEETEDDREPSRGVATVYLTARFHMVFLNARVRASGNIHFYCPWAFFQGYIAIFVLFMTVTTSASSCSIGGSRRLFWDTSLQ
jgi:hypothetical protein